jgi:exodeoxyribonuclease VIII
MTNEDYHALDAISPSRLKVLAKSPYHYFDKYLAPDRESQEPTLSMQVGTATHTQVLEPHLWDQTIVIKPDDAPSRPTEKQLIQPARTGTKAYDAWLKACDNRDWWQEFDSNNAGKLLLSAKDAAKAKAQAAAILAHPAASHLLRMDGVREPTYTWSDQEFWLMCKSRPDFHTLDREFVFDIKQTADASEDLFSKTISGFDYHVQAAWNMDAIGAKMFFYICVESLRANPTTANHCVVAVRPASEAQIDAGRRRIRSAKETLADCIASGKWPGYGDQILDPIDLPHWNKD